MGTPRNRKVAELIELQNLPNSRPQTSRNPVLFSFSSSNDVGLDRKSSIRINLDAGISGPVDQVQVAPPTLAARLQSFYFGMKEFSSWVIDTISFKVGIMCTLFLNLIFIAIDTDQTIYQQYGGIFESLDVAFLVIYSFEFLLKIISSPRGYWDSNYNKFDFFILLISYAQFATPYSPQTFTVIRAFSALRSLRALRIISFLRSLQIIINALLKTFKSIFYVITLLLVMLFVYGALGVQIFGGNTDPANPFSTLPNAIFNLVDFMTADGWTGTQEVMDDLFGQSSRLYSSMFLFLGHFLYENLLAGLIIQYLMEADKEEKEIIHKKKLEAVNKKKAFILDRQRQDMAALMETQQQMMKDAPQQSFEQILGRLVGKLNHNIIVPSSDLSCNQTWCELFMATLEHQEHTMYRTQQLHFEISNVLAEVLERRLRSKMEKV
eukprot:TRINITY_DN1374_c0_g1_i2.p1 TRINITY_DN1374_c0_g1~~TRINITY_DN1374_c0_g1_i2.p1  ORF type:complete len:437 (-),score=76.22 TRINITY_DN1374_c0_g1_i2:153-1463(-)